MDPGTQIRALRVSFRRQTAPSQRGKDPFRGEFKHRPQRHRAEAFSQVQKNIFQAIVELERYAAGSRSAYRISCIHVKLIHSPFLSSQIVNGLVTNSLHAFLKSS